MRNLPSNLWKSPVIKKRLEIEAGFECDHGTPDKEQYWAIVPFADSASEHHVITNVKENEFNVFPHPFQQEFAKDIQRKLQSEAHFNGMWLVGWTHPPSMHEIITDTGNCWYRLIMIWHDEDGDPQFTAESDFSFNEMMAMEPQYYAGLAYEAYHKWKNEYSVNRLLSDGAVTKENISKPVLESLK